MSINFQIITVVLNNENRTSVMIRVGYVSLLAPYNKSPKVGNHVI